MWLYEYFLGDKGYDGEKPKESQQNAISMRNIVINWGLESLQEFSYCEKVCIKKYAIKRYILNFYVKVENTFKPQELMGQLSEEKNSLSESYPLYIDATKWENWVVGWKSSFEG